MLEILQAGMLTTIQDLGRKAFAYYAIPKSGVMDVQAAKIAHLLLRQSEAYPLIECTAVAPQIRFHVAAQIALTGGNFGWTVNGQPVRRNELLWIEKGDVLKGGFAKEGLRGYIAVRGLLQVDEVYGAYATYTNAGIGGHEGRLLKKGDVLHWQKPIYPMKKQPTDIQVIPIQAGPEFDYLTPSAKTLLITNNYLISPDSNRMGARLRGPKLDSVSYQLKNSSPILPGFIQLPPSGLPIVILQDGQVSGGYPRIAYVPQAYLSVFNQIPLGRKCRFAYITAPDD